MLYQDELELFQEESAPPWQRDQLPVCTTLGLSARALRRMFIARSHAQSRAARA